MKSHFIIAKEEMSLYGTECTSLQNLLTVLIGPKANPSTIGELASLGVRRLSELSETELQNYSGIGETSAKRIVAAFGLAFHMNKFNREQRYVIRTSYDGANYFKDLEYLNQEHFEAVYLNTKNEVISRKNISKGTLNSTLVHPREVFKEAIRLSASSLFVAHNHPSGNPNPSYEDIEITRILVEAGKCIGIPLNDHVIIGHSGRYYSMKENNRI